MLVSTLDSGLIESKNCVLFTFIFLEPRTVPDTEKLPHNCLLTIMLPSVTDFSSLNVIGKPRISFPGPNSHEWPREEAGLR